VKDHGDVAVATPDLHRWERRFFLGSNQPVFVRPVTASDDSLIRDLFAHMSIQDRRLRFFEAIKEISPPLMSKLTAIDYSRSIAFVAANESNGDALGIVRLHGDTAGRSAEFAIAIRSDHQGRGLGWRMMQLMIEYARSMKLEFIQGQVLEQNEAMLMLCKKLGFRISLNMHEAGLRDVCLHLAG
jgi:acetyltransferase